MSYLGRCTILLTILLLLSTSRNEAAGRSSDAGRFSGSKFKFGYVHDYVTITNGLDTQETITVHCRSKDTDFGNHDLLYFNSWGFNFKPLFLGKTLYYCNFNWTGAAHSFDIFTDPRDVDRCNGKPGCLWLVQPKGPCLWVNETKGYNDCYSWKS